MRTPPDNILGWHVLPIPVLDVYVDRVCVPGRNLPKDVTYAVLNKERKITYNLRPTSVWPDFAAEKWHQYAVKRSHA